MNNSTHMKINNNNHASRPRSCSLAREGVFVFCFAVLILAAFAPSAQAFTTRTWTGAAANPADFGAATNWSGNVVPSVSAGDVAQFDGSVAGALLLAYTNTAYSGSAGNGGILLNVTATQTNSLTIYAAAGAGSIRFSNNAVAIASGAGAVSLGNGGATALGFTMGGAASTTQALNNNSANTATLGSEVTFGNGGGGTHTYAFGGTGNWTLNCPVSNGGGTVILTKSGAGTLTLNGASAAFSGGTTIGSGQTAAVIRATATQSMGTGTITFDAGGNASTARLELSGGISLNNAVAFTARGNTTVGIENISGSNTLSGALALNSGGNFYTIQSDTNLLTIGTVAVASITGGSSAKTLALQGTGNGSVVGNITAANLVAKSGAGTWTLSGSNSYVAGTTISAGTLVMASTNALSTNIVTFSGTANATLDIATDGGDYANGVNAGSSTIFTVASDVKTSGAGINHTMGIFAIGSGGTPLQMNIASGPGVSGGSPKITTGALTLSGGGGGTTIINPTTAAIAIPSVTSISSDKTLQLDGTNTGNSITGAIDNGANIVSLTKANIGTWTLGGINTYTGPTAINNGTLIVTGSLGSNTVTVAGGKLALSGSGAFSNATTVVVNSGATLDVSGVSGFTFSSGSTLMGGAVNGNFADSSTCQIIPGGSGVVGTLVFSNNLSLAGSDTIKYDFATGSNDLITVGGNLTPGGVTTINLASLPPGGLPNGTYTLMQVSGSLGGTTNNFTITGKPSPSRQSFSIVYATSPNRVQLQVTGTPGSLVWLGTPSSGWDIVTTFNWTNAASTSTDVYFDGDSVSFTDLGVANQPVLNTNVQPGQVTFNSTSDYLLSGTGAITGSGGLSKSGVSTLTITTTNNYTGVTALNGGTVSVNAVADGGVASPLGAASSATGNLTFNGGKLQYTGATGSTTHGATLNAGGGALEVTNPATTLTVSGAIAGTSGGALTKIGNGTLALSGVNTFNGATTVSAGTLAISGGNCLSDSNTVIVADVVGAALTVGASETIGSLAGGGLNGGNATIAGTLTLGGDNSSTAFGAPISGTGGLTKIGAGTFTLTNGNSFTGSLIVKSGTVVLDTGGVINNSTFNSIGSSTNDTGTLTVKGSASFTTSADFNVGDSANSVGTLNVQDSASMSLNAFYVGSGFTAGSTASGTVNQTGGSVTENNAGVGTFAVGGRNSTNGVGIYNLSAGSLTAAAGIRVGGTGTGTFNLSGSGILTANGGINIARIAGSTGTFNLNGGTFNTFNIASSTGVNATNNFNGGTVLPTVDSTTFMQGLTRANVRDGGAVIDTAGHNITINQALLHSGIAGDNATDGGLTKQNSGILTLAATNTYTGATVVNGGTLVANGSIGAGAVTVNSSATLTGNGVVNGITTNLGGTITPGSSTSIGVLSINNNLALESGSTAQFNFGTGTNSRVIVAGALNVEGGATAVTVNYISSAPAVGTYTLIQYGSLVAGSFANLTTPTSPNPRFTFVLTNDTSASAIKLIVIGNPASLVWHGDGSFNGWDNASGYQNWFNAGSPDFFYDTDNVLFDNSGSNTPSIYLTTTLLPGSVTVNSTNDYDFAGAGSLITSGNLIKSGSGTLTLEVSNTYANVTITAGTVQIGSGVTSGTLTANSVTNNGSLVFNRSDAITVANAISGGGSLTQAGSGSTSLNASNSYNGATLVNNGIVYVRNNTALGSAAGGTTVASGAELYIVENTPNIGPEALSLGGTGVGGVGALRKGGSSATAFGGTVTLTANTLISIDAGASLTLTNATGIDGSGANANLTLTGATNTSIGSVAGTVKLGTGGLTINSASSGAWSLNSTGIYSGGVVVNGGVLNVGHSQALGAGTLTVTNAAQQVNIAAGLAVTNPIVLGPGTGSGSVGNGLISGPATSGTATITGPIQINAGPGTFGSGPNAGGHFNGGNNSGGLVITGPITVDAPTTYVFHRANRLTISGGAGSSYTVFRNEATLALGQNNGLLTTATLDEDGSGGGCTFDLNGFNQTLAGIYGIGLLTNSSAGSVTLTLTAGSTNAFGGTIKDDGVNKISIVATGGTNNLSGANTYTGNTTVNGGTLEIGQATLAASSTVTATSGAILQLDFTGTNKVFGLVLNGSSQTPGVYSSNTSPTYITGPGSLLVQPGPSGPGYITNNVSGGVLSLSWPAGQNWRLQIQTNSLTSGLGTNWVDVTPGTATSTNITVNPTLPTAFYRLIYP